MEKIISEIKQAADKVAKKSSELFELSKLKLNIANTKSSIDSNFKKLGELLYNSQKDDYDISSESLENMISKIDGLYEKLTQLEEASALISNKKICPNCKKANNNDATFCSQCGFDLSDEE